MTTWKFLAAGALATALCMPAFSQDQGQAPQATNSGTQAATESASMNNNGAAITTAEQEFVTNAAQGDRADSADTVTHAGRRGSPGEMILRPEAPARIRN